VKHCEQCHGVDSWRLLAFDHDRDSSYRLEGAHRTVACGGCHAPATIGGRVVTRFRPLATACAACHMDQPANLGVSP
jgi:hypothetical protein